MVSKKIKSNKSETENSKCTEVNHKLENYENYKKNFPKSSPSNWGDDPESLPISALTSLLSSIESTTKRIEITDFLVDFFANIILFKPKILHVIILLITCKVHPSHTGIDLNIGESTVIKALSLSKNISVKEIKDLFTKTGDLGLTSSSIPNNTSFLIKPKKITCEIFLKTLKEISLIEGNSANNKKIDKIRFLFNGARREDLKYITRILLSKLRIGLLEKTIINALAIAFTLKDFQNKKVIKKEDDLENSNENLESEKEEARKNIKKLKRFINERPDWEFVIQELFAKGFNNLFDSYISLFIPVMPVLAEPSKTISEIENRFLDSKVFADEKYDGERAQVHFNEGVCKVFSRNGEDSTSKWPDLTKELSEVVLKYNKNLELNNSKIKNFILDGEIVAVDKQDNEKILSFQVLSTRKRKDVNLSEIKTKIN